MNGINIGREPALVLAFLASLVNAFSAFVFNLTVEQQGGLNAVFVAVAGLVTAVSVAQEKLVPAILGFAQAGIALGLAFGWNLTPEAQSILMGLISTGVAMFVRTQVVAPSVLRDGVEVGSARPPK